MQIESDKVGKLIDAQFRMKTTILITCKMFLIVKKRLKLLLSAMQSWIMFLIISKFNKTSKFNDD